jgi:hypothetical protein
MPGMFTAGDRVLFLTKAGDELPALVLSVSAGIYLIQPGPPSYTRPVYARETELRRPADFAPDERGRIGPRLTLTDAVDPPAAGNAGPPVRTDHPKGVRWSEPAD